MLTFIYKVKIPNLETGNQRELTLNTRQEVCDLLGISQTTFYSIMNNKMKYKNADKVHLKGIVIEKIVADINKPKNRKLEKPPVDECEEILQKRKDYINSLMQKIPA
jgi:hypothetical protein